MSVQLGLHISQLNVQFLEHLKQPLEAYMSNFPKVKILRAPERQGLIKARLRGTAVAKGPVLTFLDSHIECMEGWLEPLLDRIAINPTNVVCPVIEITNAITFEIVPLNSLQIGGFDWTLNFKWTSVSESEKKKRLDPSEAVRSPTMAGGLFAIDKAFFLKLGMYDPEFDIWGAENLELSFKTWMCGGTLEIIPCSHVSHIFREDSPIKGPPGHDYVFINSVRLAKVWMDDYAKFYFARSDKNHEGKYGDISDRVKLRENLKCNSFEWYLENVYPDLELPDDGIAYGEVKHTKVNQKIFQFDLNFRSEILATVAINVWMEVKLWMRTWSFIIVIMQVDINIGIIKTGSLNVMTLVLHLLGMT